MFLGDNWAPFCVQYILRFLCMLCLWYITHDASGKRLLNLNLTTRCDDTAAVIWSAQ